MVKSVRSPPPPQIHQANDECSYFYTEDGGDSFLRNAQRHNLQDHNPHIQAVNISNLI
jgi:hypothetical protein